MHYVNIFPQTWQFPYQAHSLRVPASEMNAVPDVSSTRESSLDADVTLHTPLCLSIGQPGFSLGSRGSWHPLMVLFVSVSLNTVSQAQFTVTQSTGCPQDNECIQSSSRTDIKCNRLCLPGFPVEAAEF
ncbi:hypothetical protein BaRGS_00009255 [Batillaria attramentaria]|uniref:Uncharacterized protein n=1 Tax=Batillaria attramentaria TaxID=370345 RepID=A0ABD0LKA4_9CAEN